MPTFGYLTSSQYRVRAGLDRVGLRDHGLVLILAQIPLSLWPWSQSRCLSLRLPSGFVRPQISPCLASRRVEDCAIRIDMRAAPGGPEATLPFYGMY